MGQPRDPFLALVEEVVDGHSIARMMLDAMRSVLGTVTQQIVALQGAREELDDAYTHGRRAMEEVADRVYAQLAELAAAHPGSQQELLAAITHIRLHMEGADPDQVASAAAVAQVLLATPVGTPVIDWVGGEWQGGQTTALPALWWDHQNTEWYVRLISGRASVNLALVTLGSDMTTPVDRTVTIGEQAIRALISRIAAEVPLGDGPGSIVDAVRDAGLPPQFLEPFIL